MKLTMSLLTALAVSGCVKQGDYCDLYSEIFLPVPIARELVKIDRPTAEQIAVLNKTYEACK